jgi:hypothetical protein
MDALLALVAKATVQSDGFGGRTAHLDVNNVPVFVKLVPVTELELEAGNRFSTANIFRLPTYYQYGIGSVGFGVWRELASHTIASDWVLSGKHEQFPLLHHWRIIPNSSDVATGTEAYEYLAHSAAVAEDEPVLRRRLNAIRASRAYVAMFVERFPQTLSKWLAERLGNGASSANDALALVRERSSEAFDFMRGQNFVHFDAHFDNVLTDGCRLYFGDYGLAVHAAFDLGPEESEFLASHTEYDATRFNSSLVHTICRAIPGSASWREKIKHLELEPKTLAPAAIASIREHTPAAIYMARLARTLIDSDRQARFSNSAASANKPE